MEDAEMPYHPEADPNHHAQAAFEQKYLDAEGVVGVGLGANALGEEAIVVYLESEGAVAILPKHFEGMDVIPEVVGAIDAQ